MGVEITKLLKYASEKNSDSISIYFEEKMILNVVGENQEQLVQYLKKIDLKDYEEKEKGSTYQYKIDCNNNWGCYLFVFSIINVLFKR